MKITYYTTYLHKLARPGPNMLFKLPIMLLSNAPKFAPLCIKLLLSKSKEKLISLTTCFPKQLRAQDLNATCQFALLPDSFIRMYQSVPMDTLICWFCVHIMAIAKLLE